MSAIASHLPSAHYQAGVVAGSWQQDAAQMKALIQFDRLSQQCTQLENPGIWQQLRYRFHRAVPRGLYLWGHVGRGKTFLTDLFYAHVNIQKKQRLHFHHFMQKIHAELRSLTGQIDPLLTVAERIGQETQLLCLDEFFVSDIGDAMILARLLEGLFAQGVILVATSNIPPRELYKEGLQRAKFIPAIALIERHCEVVELASPQDYRLRVLQQTSMYHTPLGHAAESALNACFESIVTSAPCSSTHVVIHDRIIPVKRQADGVVWFSFTALCEGPRAVADYIELARMYHTILLSEVPQFTEQMDDQARRFIELVDEFYDRNVNLVLSAAVPIVALYQGDRLGFAFARTVSRLIEMQSTEYLARAHRS